jgi:hypothetical protein
MERPRASPALELEADHSMRGARHAGYRWLWAVPFSLYTLARLPSFFEPHWYTDEAGYLTVARAVMHGRVLYSQAWTNKPPLQIWTLTVPLHLFGTSEAGLHALTFLSGLIALVAISWAGHRLLGSVRSLVAASALALLLGLPSFDAELVVPESLLLAPAAWAWALLLVRLNSGAVGVWWRWGWAVVAGVLAGMAIAYQQTELASAVALMAVMLISPTVRWHELATYMGAVAATTAAWLVPSLVLAGLGAVRFALVGFYVGYAASSSPGLGGYALLVLAAICLAAGAIVARRSAPVWAAWVWAGAELGVAAIAHRPYPHFLAPALAPAVLTLASLPLDPRRFPIRYAGLAAGAVILTILAGVSGADAKVVQAYGGWYGQAVRTGRLPSSSTLDVLDQRAPADRAVAGFLREYGLNRCRTVVWSSDAWVYLLAGIPVRLRTAPIYNDVVLEGEAKTLAQVQALDPTVIVVSHDALANWPAIEGLLQSRYQLVFSMYPDQVYVRTGSPAADGTGSC